MDTSVLVLPERPTMQPRGSFAISVMSIAELHKGVVMAREASTRARRLARLTLIEKLFEALPLDRAIAVRYGEIAARTQRLANRPHVVDGLIAATAIVLGVPVYTRDDDFDRIPDLEVVKI